MTQSPPPNGDPVKSRSTWPVVVVGAGPAGLAAAITLAEAGIECLVVDRHAGPAPHPRATALSLRTMELVRRWGLEKAVAAGGCDVELQMRVVPTLAASAHGTSVDVGFPTRAQARTISPSVPSCVPQDHFEAMLVEHVRTLPSATMHRRVEVTGVQPFNGGHVVALRDLDSGRTWHAHARYVVGADGAHSTVRDMLGVPMSTTPSVFDGISVVFHAPLWQLVGPHRTACTRSSTPPPRARCCPPGTIGGSTALPRPPERRGRSTPTSRGSPPRWGARWMTCASTACKRSRSSVRSPTGFGSARRSWSATPPTG